jgi:hypothetical protein
MQVRALQRGYDSAAGEMREAGAVFPYEGPGGSWIERVDGKPWDQPIPAEPETPLAAAAAASAFDPDGDGKPGGAPKGGNASAERKALLAKAKAAGIKKPTFMSTDALRAALAGG